MMKTDEKTNPTTYYKYKQYIANWRMRRKMSTPAYL